MTGIEASRIVLKENPESFIVECRDFDSFFGFVLSSIENRNKELYRGMTMTTVDKKTGKIGYFNIMSDLDLFQSSKKIDIPSVMDIRINKA